MWLYYYTKVTMINNTLRKNITLAKVSNPKLIIYLYLVLIKLKKVKRKTQNKIRSNYI